MLFSDRDLTSVNNAWSCVFSGLVGLLSWGTWQLLSSTWHWNDTLRFSIFFINYTLQQMMTCVTCVTSFTVYILLCMMIPLVFICIFLIWSYTKEIGHTFVFLFFSFFLGHILMNVLELSCGLFVTASRRTSWFLTRRPETCVAVRATVRARLGLWGALWLDR